MTTGRINQVTIFDLAGRRAAAVVIRHGDSNRTSQETRPSLGGPELSL